MTQSMEVDREVIFCGSLDVIPLLGSPSC